MPLDRRQLLAAFALGAASCRRATTPAAPAARVRDVRLPSVTLHTVELAGPGRTSRWVLHGGPGLDHTYLRPWLDPLAAVAPLVYVDLRGHGRSSSPPEAEGYTLADTAADLVALARARGESSVDVVAHDFGAAIALTLAARHPEVIRRLVLVAPLRDGEQVRAVARRSREALGEAGWAAIQALSTPQGTLRDPRSLPRLFRGLGRMWWHRPPSDATIDAMARSMTYRAEADANFLAAARRFDARSLASEVRAPTLVVSGDDDLTFRAEESRALAELLPHGRYHELAAAGHLPFIEQPAAFVRAVNDFLAA
ncbi:MAG: putative proline iminopeptidase [Myxococcaceae bacterium]|nr:putative proline iminopeptidase [Myxococcaceae bacterium]